MTLAHLWGRAALLPTIAESLRQQTRGKLLDSRAVVIRELSAAVEMGSCQILFLGVSGRKAQEFLRYAQKLPIVTVGEDEQFLGHGGIIRLYSQDARLRFAINAEAASRAGVSHQLLAPRPGPDRARQAVKRRRKAGSCLRSAAVPFRIT